jgi:glutamine amidotransferase
MTLAVIGVLTGNTLAVVNALRKVGADPVVAMDADSLGDATRIVLPGVGSFDEGMDRLRQADMVDALRFRVLEQGVPFLGICLGMQMLVETSEEGMSPGLGFIRGQVIRFQSEVVPGGRVPHMGWNRVRPARPTPLFQAEDPDRRFYFVHSYHVVPQNLEDVLALSTYGHPFAAAIQQANLTGVQFHPEKSLRWGLDFLERFVAHG